MDETSLDDFVSGDGTEGDTAESDDQDDTREGDTEQEVDGSTDAVSSATEPAPATSRWSAGGTACAACGAGVHRLWDSADGLVCASCKKW